ncbi:protein FREE1 [Malania oleifera]|uniref:protein FREE1 n=1 Tax=Malania oleifera TaxID=397392 RepID=UPI0025ADD7BD|nr:protein FREE1 [Malania oleifera]
MQQGDFSSLSYYQYPQNPHLQNPNPSPLPNPSPNPIPADPIPNPLPPSYASAPPFTTNYSSSSSDFPNYPSQYPPYPQNPDPISSVPPTAPSYSTGPNLPPLNPPPQPPSSLPPYPPSTEVPGPYLAPTQQQSYFPPFDQHQTAACYAPPNPNPNSSSNSPYSSLYSSSYSHVASSVPPSYESPYENSPKFEPGAGYFDETSSRYSGGYSRTRSDLGSDLYGKRADSGTSRYDSIRDDVYGDGVYAYEGGKVEPYGARGTSSKSSTWSVFDDYGRSISFPSGKDQDASAKIVRAVPKVDTQQDVKNGVQKFRVKLLPETGGQSTMEVLCQVGLDGIRMLDPSSNRTLRIYPLETVTRCDVTDSSTFAFWSKSSVDFEPRRIRLQSNSYTTNTLLDTVTAATVQFKEMGGRSRPDSFKTTEQSIDKKKGLTDWMNLIKPVNEEKDHWVPDEAVSKCTACGTDFGAFVRRHHCRNCGDIFCDKCTHGRIALTVEENAQPVRVCDRCMAEVTQRLSNAKEAANKPAGLQSHEDLARKLQEELERNRKGSSGSKPDGSGRRMREVACPICTVHLQVQVPSSGSETIECGVCQHPFLVSAH